MLAAVQLGGGASLEVVFLRWWCRFFAGGSVWTCARRSGFVQQAQPSEEVILAAAVG